MTLKKILCVDDEADMRQITQLALQGMGGYEVALCEKGEDVLAAIDASDPDLVMLDVMMPGMDGIETLKTIRTKYPDIAVAFLTAKTEESELAELTALGVIGIVAKPFNPMTLADSVKAVWDNR